MFIAAKLCLGVRFKLVFKILKCGWNISMLNRYNKRTIYFSGQVSGFRKRSRGSKTQGEVAGVGNGEWKKKRANWEIESMKGA